MRLNIVCFGGVWGEIISDDRRFRLATTAKIRKSKYILSANNYFSLLRECQI